MASEETQPLLIKINPSWNRRPKFSSISAFPAHAKRSNANVQITGKDDTIKVTETVIGNGENSRKIKFAIICILTSVVLERMVFYGFVGNLILFLNLDPFNWTAYSAVCAIFLFYGVSYIMSVLGGWISDSFLGRFKTMILSYVIYICGYIMLPLLATNTGEENSNASLPLVCMSSEIPTSNSTLFGEPCSWLIAIILTIIAIAAGILKAVICPFGSDQLVRATQQTQLSFFNWFYWCVNIGSFLGLGIITYIEQQQRFFYGFVACSVGLSFSALICIAGFPFYTSRPPDGSVLTNIVRIFREAFRNKQKLLMIQQNFKNPHLNRSSSDIDNAVQVEGKVPFLDYAKQRYGGTFDNCLVDDVKKLGMILAVFAVLIPYWLVYFQMQTTFMFQGLNMRLSFGVPISNVSKMDNSGVYKPEITVAWFTLCDALFVIILLPLFDRIIYPRMARAGYHFTFAKRIILGMVFAAAAMVAAGVVEHFRWESLDPDLNATCFRSYIQQKIGSKTYNASDMSILWQIPQYALIGISEVFASVACLQFAVMVAPKSMKAAITGLYYFFCGIGGFLGTALVALLINFNIWLPDHHSNCWYPCGSIKTEATHMCHVDYYFFFLAGFEGLGLILFVVVAKVYKLNIDELTLHARLKNEAAKGGNGNDENIPKTLSS